MATVVYDGPFDGVALPDGREFVKGTPADVDDALAASLLTQDFKSVEVSKSKGAA